LSRAANVDGARVSQSRNAQALASATAAIVRTRRAGAGGGQHSAWHPRARRRIDCGPQPAKQVMSRALEHAVDLQTGEARSPLPPCRNCGESAPDQFCPRCGQETRVSLPTLREFMREAMGRLVAFDGRLWRTLVALAFRPGF